MKVCSYCKEFKPMSEFHRRNKGSEVLLSVCKSCKKNENRARRRQFKLDCITHKGGKCEICGIIGSPAIYDLHHTNPEEKEFSFGETAKVRLDEAVKAELDKCLLLCSNCHRELHYLKEDSSLPLEASNKHPYAKGE